MMWAGRLVNLCVLQEVTLCLKVLEFTQLRHHLVQLGLDFDLGSLITFILSLRDKSPCARENLALIGPLVTDLSLGLFWLV
jgi:hypothetical protein